VRAAPAADTPAKAPAKSVTKEVPAAKAKEPVKTPPAVKAKSKAGQAAFLASQHQLLLDERVNYLRSADALKAQADSLALEHEPGDVQFDEEGGEGGTSNVDRELDLVLSAQARAAAVEIDRALSKIEIGTYGLCEQCGQPIPDARLQALPQAALCVACKSGGLSSRR
jgi:DnaK suppressor protein